VKRAEPVLGRSNAIIFVVLVLAALGVRLYLIAPRSIFPAVSFARIDVVADGGNLTAERRFVWRTRDGLKSHENGYES
jgi:ABC-type amino acid transport substrate-binding protein